MNTRRSFIGKGLVAAVGLLAIPRLAKPARPNWVGEADAPDEPFRTISGRSLFGGGGWKRCGTAVEYHVNRALPTGFLSPGAALEVSRRDGGPLPSFMMQGKIYGQEHRGRAVVIVPAALVSQHNATDCALLAAEFAAGVRQNLKCS